MTRRTVLGLVALILSSAALGWRIHALRRPPPPPIVLMNRAAELGYVRYLGHRLQSYAIAYGRPIYHYEVKDSRYAVEFASTRIVPAESTEIANLRRLLYQPHVDYGFDRHQAYITWDPTVRGPTLHVTRDSFPWPVGVGNYISVRKASVAPRNR